MPTAAINIVRPTILLAESEVEKLSALAFQMEQSSPQAANMLLDEIERAEVLADADMPADVVRMNSTVQFLDRAHGQRRTVLLVYPSEADISAGKVSVLTPVGAGLIGLRAGQEIHWPDREGHLRPLKILKVKPPSRLAL